MSDLEASYVCILCLGISLIVCWRGWRAEKRRADDLVEVAHGAFRAGYNKAMNKIA